MKPLGNFSDCLTGGGFPSGPIVAKSGGIMAPARPTKITFAEMRDMGVRGILVYCADYRCSHSIAISGDAWPDEPNKMLSGNF